MAQKALRVDCKSGKAGDFVEFEPSNTYREKIYVRGVFGGEPTPSSDSIWLNAEDARELFNWLGVWLHTYKGAGS